MSFPAGACSKLKGFGPQFISGTDLQQLLSSCLAAVLRSHTKPSLHVRNQRAESLSYLQPFHSAKHCLSSIIGDFGASLCHERLSLGKRSDDLCSCSEKDLQKIYIYIVHPFCHLFKKQEKKRHMKQWTELGVLGLSLGEMISGCTREGREG